MAFPPFPGPLKKRLQGLYYSGPGGEYQFIVKASLINMNCDYAAIPQAREAGFLLF